MPYKVIRAFADITDRSDEYPNGRLYEAGDKYPANGKATAERLRELSTTDNTAGSVFISEDTTAAKKKRKASDDDDGGNSD